MTRLVDMRKRDRRGRLVREPLAVRFWRAVERRADGCWPWLGARHYKGYGEFQVAKNEKTKAHRVAYALSYGPISDGAVVCHKCDNPPCCNPAHLFLGTERDNKLDAVGKRRHAHGVKHGKAKLTEGQVRQIRELDRAGIPRIHLAAQFGVSGRNVTDICRRKTWAHIK